MNRRSLLVRGAAAMGAVAAGLSLEPGKASGQMQGKAGDPGMAGHMMAPAAGPNLQPPIVTVKGGKLRGFTEDKTYTFRGIQYAAAVRFELPKPVQPWEGIKNAQTFGVVSPVPEPSETSIDEFAFPHRYWIENEHCQNLNVWTPTLDRAAKKPVMVWMHGGGFTNGSAIEGFSYDGKSLSDFGDVVVVSVNHRLNILGTLDLSAYGDKWAKSRYTGTADLVASLKWVHENIEAFGGDPGSVMIFGQSGGGGKVTRMLQIEEAKGLFHKLAVESGAGHVYRGTNPAEVIKTQQKVAAYTLTNLGLDGTKIDELQKVPYEKLLAAGNAAMKQVGKEIGKPEMTWDVIADNDYVKIEFLDWADSIPMIAGYNFSEHVSTMNLSEYHKNEWTAEQINAKLTSAFGDKKDAVIAEFKKSFPDKKVQDVYFYSALSRPIVQGLLNTKLEKAKAPVYNYLFSYEAEVNGGTTPFHCAEIAFVFHNVGLRETRIATGGTQSAHAMQNIVSQAWVNFARTNNPSVPGLVWKPYTVQDKQAMVFDVVSESRNLHDEKLIDLMKDAKQV